MALYLWTVMNVKEQVQRDVAAPSIKESFGTLRHNKPLLWLCLGSLSFLTGMTAIGALGAYYALYVLNDATYIAWNSVAQVVGTFLVAAFIPKIVRVIGKRNGFIVLGFVGVWPVSSWPSSPRASRSCPWSASSCWASAWAG